MDRHVHKKWAQTPLSNTFTMIHGGDRQFPDWTGVARRTGLLSLAFRIIYGALQPLRMFNAGVQDSLFNDFSAALFIDCLLYNIKGLTINGPVWRRPMNSAFLEVMADFLVPMAKAWLDTWL